jgi:hypothetical protein
MGRPASMVPGDKFGNFTLLERVVGGTAGKHARFIVECALCGNHKEMSSQHIKKKNSCGCAQNDSSTWKHSTGAKNRPWQLSEGEAARNLLYAAYKGRDTRKGRHFSFTLEEFSAKIVQDCFYCGKNGGSLSKGLGKTSGDFPYTGLDRIDSSKGYSPENTQPCCKICNTMKNTLTHEEFLSHIELIKSKHL